MDQLDNIMSIASDSEFYKSNTIANSFPILEHSPAKQPTSSSNSHDQKAVRRIQTQINLLKLQSEPLINPILQKRVVKQPIIQPEQNLSQGDVEIHSHHIRRNQTFQNLTQEQQQFRDQIHNEAQSIVNSSASFKKVQRALIKQLFAPDLNCSVCLQQFVKPVTLMCGHSFCRLCIFKYLLQYPKKCPLCRNSIDSGFQELRVNVVLDALSRKMYPKQYNKILAHNEAEERSSRLIENLQRKFGQNYRPNVRERMHMILHHLKYYYTRLRVIVTIAAPIIILIWYYKYRNKIDSAQYWEDMRRHKMMFFSVPFDITQETFIVRIAQLLSLLVGF